MNQPLQASKWLKSPILIDTEEMASLFDALGDFSLYTAGAVTSKGQGEISRSAFLDLYHDYILALREGREPDLNACRQPFSSIITATDDALYILPVEEERQLIRVRDPVIQMQMHTMAFTQGKFQSMVLGKQAISWGIQFSYPQLVQRESRILKVDETFPNTALFRALQKWVRSHTLPTPFVVDSVTINASQRLGKNCLSWINNHPHLRNLYVETN